jgi:hypothetical protein
MLSPPNSFDRTASTLKGKSYYKDFVEASSANIDAPDEVNSISKLTILQAMRNCSVCLRIVASVLSHLV